MTVLVIASESEAMLRMKQERPTANSAFSWKGLPRHSLRSFLAMTLLPRTDCRVAPVALLAMTG